MIEGSDTALPENPTREELARALLLYKMREYSEAMCASWLSDVEFDIWELGNMVESGPREPDGQRRNAQDCRKLGALASGWWVWDAGRQRDQNPHFITLTEWADRHAAWRVAWLEQSRERAREAAENGMEPEAAARWAGVSAMDQAGLLNRVWCGHCRIFQPLVASGGRPAFIGGGLWLTGTCPGCGGLLQTEYPGRTSLTPQL